MKKTLLFFGILALLVGGAAFVYSAIAPSLTGENPAPKQGSEVEDKGSGIVCAQVITPARDPETGDIKEFPTPCDVPEGWEPIQNDIPDLDLI